MKQGDAVVNWGFYYKFLTNINKVNQYLGQFAPFSGEYRRIVSEDIPFKIK